MKLLTLEVDYIRRHKRGPWKYLLQSDTVYQLGFDAGVGELWSKTGRLLGYWNHFTLTICAGYAWDGMTCYPDTHENKEFSLVHDFCYQASNCPDSPFARKEVDGWAWDLIDGKNERRIVLLGVQMFGWFFWSTGKTDCYVIIIIKRP